MTNLRRLSVIALLTGTLGLVGCGDDETDTGGTGGTGATGGTGGAGGGAGGSGGAGGGAACVQDCGVGNELPVDATQASVPFTCSVMGIGIPLEVNFAGAPTAPVMAGMDNTYDLTAQAIITVDTVNLILALADESDITGTTGLVTPIGGTTSTTTADLVLDGVPCKVCYVRDMANTITLPITQATWALDEMGATAQVVELTDVTINIDAAGLALELSNVGDAPACFWGAAPDNSPTMPADPPALTFPTAG